MTRKRSLFEQITSAPRRRNLLAEGECKICDDRRPTDPALIPPGPPHDPSPRCESGGHPHCTCDTCF